MADSAGEMDEAFDNMSSTGESLRMVLANQMHALMDWAGALASSSGPYVEWIANSGAALMGIVQLSHGVKTMVAGLKAMKVATLAQAAASKRWQSPLVFGKPHKSPLTWFSAPTPSVSS